ncbi:hypothetical protein GWN26_15500 [Candidatus Saccharibacteria bacterium]|nr:hypothetical protein [Candidatus Saccharibacteria bacterium]
MLNDLFVERQIYIIAQGLSQDKKIPMCKKIVFNLSTLWQSILGLRKNNAVFYN